MAGQDSWQTKHVSADATSEHCQKNWNSFAASAHTKRNHPIHGRPDSGTSRPLVAAHEVSLPGLAPLQIRSSPAFLVDGTRSEHSKASVGREKPKVLVNTADLLEAAALQDMRQHLDVFAVGPMVPLLQQAGAGAEDRIHLHLHLCEQDHKAQVRSRRCCVSLWVGGAKRVI
ncbi:hypothetical protein PAHAL_3G023400 [Panicum hallii]|jgi:hypothetical protein|uniref:Uncharacterized protein n=1 Tax=Panicum hallii TaxID=206008 RepID=A0A2T8KGT3_9POAL|nr:hypothetical protein PAHAL_3G023400 [Panicum hallii]